MDEDNAGDVPGRLILVCGPPWARIEERVMSENTSGISDDTLALVVRDLVSCIHDGFMEQEDIWCELDYFLKEMDRNLDIGMRERAEGFRKEATILAKVKYMDISKRGVAFVSGSSHGISHVLNTILVTEKRLCPCRRWRRQRPTLRRRPKQRRTEWLHISSPRLKS